MLESTPHHLHRHAQDHAHDHGYGHGHEHAPSGQIAGAPGFSLLRLSAGGRVLGAALLIALLWAAVYGALA